MVTPSPRMPLRTFFNCKSAMRNAQKFMGQVRSVLQRVVKRLAFDAAGVRTRQGTDEIYRMPKISPNSFV
jgi:hypothetical protein